MKLVKHRPSPATVIALVALFVALGGVGVAATGGNFILGNPNTAADATALSSGVTTGPTLELTNTGGKPAARFNASGTSPFVVSNGKKVQDLNADRLDDLDSTAFVRQAGTILIAAGGSSWTARYGSTLQNFGDHVSLTGGNSYGTADLSPDLPVALYGKKLRLDGVQLCYDAADPELFLDRVQLTVTATSTDPRGTPVAQATDDTDRNDIACRTYSMTPAHVLQENEAVTLEVDGKWAAPLGLDLSRATFVLAPTNNPAKPPS